MKKLHLFIFICFVSALPFFPESPAARDKQTVMIINREELSNSESVPGILGDTVTSSIRSLLLQTNQYTVLPAGAEVGADIVITHSVSKKNDIYVMRTEARNLGDATVIFAQDSPPFDILETFETCDAMASAVLEKLTGEKFPFGRLVINQGSIPDSDRIFLNGNELRPQDLKRIIAGEYSLKVTRGDGETLRTVVEISPLTIAANGSTSLNYDTSTKAGTVGGETDDSSYVSKGEYLGFSEWRNAWRIHESGKTVITFRATADQDLTIGLSTDKKQIMTVYQINAGSSSNTKTVLRKFNGYDPSDFDNSIIATSYNTIKKTDDYWLVIDKDDHSITMGWGPVENYRRIIRGKSNKSLDMLSYFSFSSWGSRIEYSNIKVHE